MYKNHTQGIIPKNFQQNRKLRKNQDVAIPCRASPLVHDAVCETNKQCPFVCIQQNFIKLKCEVN